MATYLELFQLRANSDLQDRAAVAVTKKAQTLLDLPTPTAAQVAWALAAIEAPKSKAAALLNYILAANSSATVGQITGATDANLQSQLSAAVDAIIAGGA